ncbi:MAG: hypothetical protein CK547_01455 [Chitinophagaceae bacterium]|nr:MAG: hypothetical protein CK547_01455 [Chitinophagaceae bacterium]
MRIFLFLMLLVISIASCRSTRKITTVITKKDSAIVVVNPAESDSAKSVRELIKKIESKQILFNTFSSKVKVDYSDEKNNRVDFNAFVRMQKDSAIWVSIIAALNIEAYRVMITKDSVVIMDKIERTIQRKPLEYLQKITKVPFDFKTLEDLIVGNPVYLDKNVTSFIDQGETFSMSTLGEVFKHFITVNKKDLNLIFSKLDDIDVTRSRTANLTYADYSNVGSWMFSGLRKISLSEKTKIDVQLEFKQVEFEKPLSFPFSIPKSYKVK